MGEHTCSARTPEVCPNCGHEDTRDGFEGCEVSPRDAAHGRAKFVARCPKCEHLHPDQRDHDDAGCEACFDAELDALEGRGPQTATERWRVGRER